MGAISFSNPDESWVVARWAFWQFLDDVQNQFPGDIEMSAEFEEAKALDGLHLSLLNREFAERIERQITRVAAGILDGSIHSTVSEKYLDEDTPKCIDMDCSNS